MSTIHQTMSSSIKHRRHSHGEADSSLFHRKNSSGKSPSSPGSAVNGNSNSNSNGVAVANGNGGSTKIHGRPSSDHSSYHTLVLTLGVATMLLTTGILLFPKRTFHEEPTAPNHDEFGPPVPDRLRGAAADMSTSNKQNLIPFSALPEVSIGPQSPGYAQNPLTGGPYTLGPDYLLHKPTISSESNSGHNLVTGTIEFPHVDLADHLSEEAEVPVDMNAFLRNMNQGGPLSQAVVDKDSFLVQDDATFKSVLNVKFNGMDKQQQPNHALLTRRGYKMGKTPNQDRSFIVNFNLVANDDQDTTLKLKHILPTTTDQQPISAVLMGIFDGHGGRGHEVSHHLALGFTKAFTSYMQRQGSQQLPVPFLQSLGKAQYHNQLQSYIHDIMIRTFTQMDDSEPVKGSGGSTASVLFYPGIDSRVYIANTGDSTTLIAAYSKSTKQATIVYQNRKHKPHLPDEKSRIEKAGGQVMIPPSVLQEDDGSDGLKETSRLIIPDSSGNIFGGLALAMSRSIGDVDGKGVGLIAEPEVDVWNANEWYVKHKQQRSDIEVSCCRIVLKTWTFSYSTLICTYRH